MVGSAVLVLMASPRLQWGVQPSVEALGMAGVSVPWSGESLMSLPLAAPNLYEDPRCQETNSPCRVMQFSRAQLTG
jgi:hypothetical protein